MTETTQISVGDIVRGERAKRRLSQEALARRAGLCTATVSNIENGSTPSLLTASKIAKALRISLDSMIPTAAAA